MQQAKLSNDSAADCVCASFQEMQKALAEAREHIEGGETASSDRALENVRRILTHLYSTLDLVHGGDLVLQLQQLHDFVMAQTLVISSSYDLKELDALDSIIEHMWRAWQELAIQPTPAPAGTSASSARTRA